MYPHKRAGTSLIRNYHKFCLLMFFSIVRIYSVCQYVVEKLLQGFCTQHCHVSIDFSILTSVPVFRGGPTRDIPGPSFWLCWPQPLDPTWIPVVVVVDKNNDKALLLRVSRAWCCMFGVSWDHFSTASVQQSFSTDVRCWREMVCGTILLVHGWAWIEKQCPRLPGLWSLRLCNPSGVDGKAMEPSCY